MGVREQCEKRPLGFYIYIYIDPDTLEPFYVGKGCGTRWRTCGHNTKYNKGLATKLKKLSRLDKQPIIDIVQDELSEELAFSLEQAFIITIGRRDLKTGPLFNLTNGGEGSAGHYQPTPWNKGKKLSKEHLKKISESLRGRKFTEKHKQNLSESLKRNPGKRGTKEWIEKQRKAHLGQRAWNKGRKHSPETRLRISEALRQRNLKIKESKNAKD